MRLSREWQRLRGARGRLGYSDRRRTTCIFGRRARAVHGAAPEIWRDADMSSGREVISVRRRASKRASKLAQTAHDKVPRRQRKALDQAARDALAQCLFQPETLDGKPVASKVIMPYEWINASVDKAER